MMSLFLIKEYEAKLVVQWTAGIRKKKSTYVCTEYTFYVFAFFLYMASIRP